VSPYPCKHVFQCTSDVLEIPLGRQVRKGERRKTQWDYPGSETLGKKDLLLR
jgi:hypothetical protein